MFLKFQPPTTPHIRTLMANWQWQHILRRWYDHRRFIGLFVSCIQSRDGDVDIWEGLVETNDDEALEEPPRPSPLGQSSFSLTDAHSTEERRAEDPLNQSMVSTLSTSRASSVSASGNNQPSSEPRTRFETVIP
jgi:hypothetical protein